MICDGYPHFIVGNGVKGFVLCHTARGRELGLLISPVNSGPYTGEAQRPLVLPKSSYLHLRHPQRCRDLRSCLPLTLPGKMMVRPFDRPSKGEETQAGSLTSLGSQRRETVSELTCRDLGSQFRGPLPSLP